MPSISLLSTLLLAAGCTGGTGDSAGAIAADTAPPGTDTGGADTGGGTGGGAGGGAGGDTDTGDSAPCEMQSWYMDRDGDGYGDPADAVSACERPEGGVSNDRDCDDADPYRWPGADERCDGTDDDCDGAIDEDLPVSDWWPDEDGDGFGSADGEPAQDCREPPRSADNPWDCDDAVATEVPVFVDSAAAGAGDGRQTSPYSSLSYALSRGATCLILRPGSYEPAAIDVGVIRIVGEGADTTRIAGDGSTTSGACVAVHGDASLILEGVSLSSCAGYEVAYTSNNCSAYYDRCVDNLGGGLYSDSTGAVTLRDVDIVDNVLPYGVYTEGREQVYRYGYGGAIYQDAGSLRLEDVTIRGNAAVYGGIMMLSDVDVAMVRLRVAENDGYIGGIYASSSSLDISASVLASNSVGYGVIYQYDGSASIRHSTFAGNHAPSSYPSADLRISGATLELSDSILSFNQDYGLYDGYGTAVVDYTDLYGAGLSDSYGVSPTGTGQLSADPQFVSFSDDGVDNDDLRLAPGSPCVDAGSPDHSDLDGSPADLGAYGGPDGGW